MSAAHRRVNDGAAGVADALEGVQQQLAEAMARAPFKSYAKQFLFIENKRNQIVPFELNEAQLIVDEVIEREIADNRPVRCLILKGRQQGMSSYAQGRIAHFAFTRRIRCLTVGHQLPSVHELYGKLDRALRQLGTGVASIDLAKGGIDIVPPLEPGAGEKGRRMVFADPLGSICRYDSAHDPDGVGRGMTAQVMHLTEVPQWKKPDDTMQALLATLPPDPGTMVLVETTAKGASGWFYDKWVEAMDAIKRGQRPRWQPIFVPWYKTSEYARKRESGEPRLNRDELEFQQKHSLTDEQCYWYRDARREFGERVTEEYPSTWEEAFLSSGLPFFRRDTMAELRDYVMHSEPIRTGRFKVMGRTAIWQNEPGGATRIYGNPEEGHRYSIGVDFASGRAKDFSAIVVVDVDTGRIVCTHKSKWQPDHVLDEAVLLGLAYACDGKPALIVPERNGIGQALVDRLVTPKSQKGLGYPNVYREHDTVAVKHHRGARYGWATSNRTRQWLLEELARHVHQSNLSIPCPFVVEEMGLFVYTDDEGQHAAAQDGANDDLVMALAFAVRGMTFLPAARASDARLQSPADRREATISSRTGY